MAGAPTDRARSRGGSPPLPRASDPRFAAGLVATWYPGRDFRKRGYDVHMLGYNTDRKVHVRRLDTNRDFYVWPHELGGVPIDALNEKFAQLPYIPRKGGHDPGYPALGSPAPQSKRGDDDPLAEALL